MTAWNFVLIPILIALNGFFVGVEFAAVASRRARLDILVGENNSRSAHLVREWLDNPAARERVIAATQLGITVVSLALGAVGENAFAAILEPYFLHLEVPSAILPWVEKVLPALPLLISLTLVTSLHVVLGEQVPKVATLRSPERFALATAPIMDIFSKVFKGFINILDWSTRLVLSMIGLPSSATHTSLVSVEELKYLVSGPEVEGVIEPSEQKMLTAVIDFGELVVRQVSVPRTEIVAIEANTPLAEIIICVSKEKFTKFPVYEENLDHITGILHVRDLLSALQDSAQRESKAVNLAREALFIPETIAVNDLLLQFRLTQQHMAIVLDEFGGTAGLVTLQDLLDEIVGEVRDSFDAAPPSIQSLHLGSFIIEGMTLIEEVNQHFGLHLMDAHYDTIAGYILGRLGRIPLPGDGVEDVENQVRLVVESMDHLRIATVKLTRLEAAQVDAVQGTVDLAKSPPPAAAESAAEKKAGKGVTQ